MALPAIGSIESPDATSPSGPTTATGPVALPVDMTPFQPLERLMQDMGMSEAGFDLVTRAYVRARAGARGRHAQEWRAIHHAPRRRSVILAEMQLDAETLAAALLHDVPEDTSVTVDDLRAQFGERVARLVDGVTKLERIEWNAGSEDVRRRRACARCSSRWRTMCAWC